MKFEGTRLPGAFVIGLEKREDERGFFSRTWCRREFAEHGLVSRIVQANLSYNRRRGTLRGLHYQIDPHSEVKVVRCSRGAIFDVVIDLRPGSPTYMQWVGVELRSDDYRMLYVPENFAHGFLTLEDDTEVVYQVSEFYAPEAERGIRYDDPAFDIRWPLAVSVISDKDGTWPDWTASLERV